MRDWGLGTLEQANIASNANFAVNCGTRDRPRETPLQSDREIITRLKMRDPTALEDLYNRYGRRVYAFAYRVVGDRREAEEFPSLQNIHQTRAGERPYPSQ